jgi:hypothetical protein
MMDLKFYLFLPFCFFDFGLVCLFELIVKAMAASMIGIWMGWSWEKEFQKMC